MCRACPPKKILRKICVSDYGYGNISKTLRNAVKWLNVHKRSLSKQDDFFDFPDYWGMPKTISSRLGTDEVDFLQAETYDWFIDNYERKYKFGKHYNLK